ncbi:MAG: hypothetical protein WBN92_21015 [Terriglobia bacterium]
MLKIVETEKGVALNRVRYLHEITFSIYFPLLIIMANSVRSILHPAGSSWVDSLCLLFTRGRSPQSYADPTLRFAFACLWAVSAAVLFLCLRSLAGFSFTRLFLRIFAGIVALIGFPLALWYVTFRTDLPVSGFPRALLNASYYYVPHWFVAELAATLVGAFFYVFRKWPAKTGWAVALLILHFGIWACLVLLYVGAGSGNILLWPGYSWTPLTRAYPSLIYPLLGFVASLAWGVYVRQSAESLWPRKRDPAQ